MPWFEFESRTFLWFYHYLSCVENHVCFVSWCIGDRCDMMSSHDDLGKSRRLSAGGREWSNISQVLSGRMIERLGDAVCGTMHKEMGSASFLVWPQNHDRRFPGLGLKTGNSYLVIWVSKSPRRFLGLNLKTKLAMVCRL
jgi:hypothetical protein